MKHSITQVISEKILTGALKRIEKGNEKEKILSLVSGASSYYLLYQFREVYSLPEITISASK